MQRIFNMIGYEAGLNDEHEFSENQSLTTLQRYAAAFGLDRATE